MRYSWDANLMLLADSNDLVDNTSEKLIKLVADLGKVSKRRKLKINVRKSKVMKCSASEGVEPLRKINNKWRGRSLKKLRSSIVFVFVSGMMEVEVSHRMNEKTRIMGDSSCPWRSGHLSSDP